MIFGGEDTLGGGTGPGWAITFVGRRGTHRLARGFRLGTRLSWTCDWVVIPGGIWGAADDIIAF